MNNDLLSMCYQTAVDSTTDDTVFDTFENTKFSLSEDGKGCLVSAWIWVEMEEPDSDDGREISPDTHGIVLSPNGDGTYQMLEKGFLLEVAPSLAAAMARIKELKTERSTQP